MPMGDFCETYARTARKYGGARATATQSLNDYDKADGPRAALRNSDVMRILQQKAETISDFRQSARLDMDDRTETLIRSLKRSGAEYSEIFIKGPETEAIGRLVLDPLSATIFSSDPGTYAAIQALEAKGMRSEEHTSELQSLMRISYAVFCLKKKKLTNK